MPFGFGASSSSSNSSSQSTDSSIGGSSSGGFSQSGSEQNIAFEDIFARLFGGAEGAAGGLDPSMLTDTANSLFSSGTGFMDQIGGNAGTSYLEDRISGDNPMLQEQIDLMGEDLGKFFGETLNPQITSQAVGGGQLGGGRQGVAQGQAMQQVGEQFTRGSVALRAGDMQARDLSATTLAGNSIQGAMAGFQGMGALMGVADAGFSAGMAPYERLAAILGGPTTLGSSSSSSADWANAFSQSYGQSSANSNSRGRSFGFTPG